VAPGYTNGVLNAIAPLRGTILRDPYPEAIAHSDAGQDRSAVSDSAWRIKPNG
jgi:hypothetical protein